MADSLQYPIDVTININTLLTSLIDNLPSSPQGRLGGGDGGGGACGGDFLGGVPMRRQQAIPVKTSDRFGRGRGELVILSPDSHYDYRTIAQS